MLKIKDDVDLKELEKFGIKKVQGDFVGLKGQIYCGIGERIYIVGYSIESYSEDDLDTLYDLIQAGLIEKV